MSNSAHNPGFRLWCLVDGESTPFKVAPPANADVDDLKDFIREKRVDIPAKDLVLWKPKQSILLKPSRTLAQRIHLPSVKLSDIADELDEPSENVSAIFSESLEGCLHIIVRVPTTPSSPPENGTDRSLSQPPTSSISTPASTTASIRDEPANNIQDRVRNVIVFGETGAGKSSVINMLHGGEEAPISMNLTGETFASARYLKTIRGSTFTIFDTAGLNDTVHALVPPPQAIGQLYKLIHALKDNGVSLLVYVMRAPRLKSTAQKNYELFWDIFCEGKVPIVIIVTGLEVVDNMEEWLEENKADFHRHNMFFKGHACITSIKGKKLGNGRHVYEQEYLTSKKKVEDLIYQFRDTEPWRMPSKTWIDKMVARVYVFLAETLNLDSKIAARDLRVALQTYGGLSKPEAASLADSLERAIQEVRHLSQAVPSGATLQEGPQSLQ